MKEKSVLKYIGIFSIVMFFLIMPVNAGITHLQDESIIDLSANKFYQGAFLEINFSDEPENYKITIEPGNDDITWSPDRVSYVYELPLLNEAGDMNGTIKCSYVYFSLIETHNYNIHGESWFKEEGKPVYHCDCWHTGYRWRGGMYIDVTGIPRLLHGWFWANATVWSIPEEIIEYHHAIGDYDEDGEFMELYNWNTTKYTEPPEEPFMHIQRLFIENKLQ